MLLFRTQLRCLLQYSCISASVLDRVLTCSGDIIALLMVLLETSLETRHEVTRKRHVPGSRSGERRGREDDALPESPYQAFQPNDTDCPAWDYWHRVLRSTPSPCVLGIQAAAAKHLAQLASRQSCREYSIDEDTSIVISFI